MPVDAGAVTGWPVNFWKHWSVQITALCSLVLQVVLFFFAGIRRSEAHGALRFMLWQAYMGADSTASYALGHLTIWGAAPAREHQLAAFWATFFLLHLGGPDTITAYSLEDNQLWGRHLQTCILQVFQVVYVVWNQFRVNSDLLLRAAAILMLAVGAVKYLERIQALKCGTMDIIRSALEKDQSRARHHHFHPLDQGFRFREEAAGDGEEFYIRGAHSLFHLCKHAIADSGIENSSENQGAEAEIIRALRSKGDYKGMWTLMEVELSLLYDILYTKAAVIHTWYGYCIRLVTSLSTAASLLLFGLSDKDGHGKVDVVVTYALLAVAFLLETASLLAALGSSWTYIFLCTTPWSWLRNKALCTGWWDRLRRLVKKITLRRGSLARRLSGKIGQFNMLHMCSHGRSFMVPKHRMGAIQLSDELREWLFKYIERLVNKRRFNTQGVLRKSWGQEPLEAWGLYEYFSDGTYLGVELQEGIIIWHIATDVFLAKSNKNDAEGALLKSIRTLSNYMMFLLVEHTYMLPGLAQTRLYQRTYKNLVEMWNKRKFSLRDDPKFSGLMPRDQLAIILYDHESPGYRPDVPRLIYANKVAEKLLEQEKEKGSTAVLELVRDVWMDFLVYAANRCNRESHAMKLSTGGELTTVVWLMIYYLHHIPPTE